MVGDEIEVWSPDAEEYVEGTVYFETDTYVSVQTETGRCVGGPKSMLLAP